MLKKAWFVAMIDSVLVNLCIVSVFSIRFQGSVPLRNLRAYQSTWIYITAAFLLFFYLQGLYDNDENDDGISIFFKVLSSVTIGTVCLMALTFISRAFAFPRTVIMISYAVMLALFGLWHVFVHRRFLGGLPMKKCVIYGGPDRLEHLEKCVKQEPRYEFVASAPAGSPEKLEGILVEGSANTVIIADDVPQAQELAFDLFLKHPGISFFVMPRVADIIAGSQHRKVVGDVPLILLGHSAIYGRFNLIKRAMDFSVAIAGTACLLPFFILVAVAIKLTSRGPVFYTQPRVGRAGIPFQIIKFRTMVENAEEYTGPMLSDQNDSRVTPLGRLLRRLKIDEFPQLINILKGDMSLVGPRPERPEFVEKFERAYPAYTHRKQALPGITGLAQVNGRYETDPSLKLKYDLIYIYNYRPRMDITILYQTIQFILRVNI